MLFSFFIEEPIDGGFGEWSTYSECSDTCGVGIQSRTRKCDNPAPLNGGADCAGKKTETRLCYTNNCHAVLITCCPNYRSFRNKLYPYYEYGKSMLLMITSPLDFFPFFSIFFSVFSKTFVFLLSHYFFATFCFCLFVSCDILQICLPFF